MTFNSLILFWFDENKRELPWRSDKDPYKIWLSEIILQQTRVNQGTAYYHQFTENYPDVYSLAAASEQEVLKLWQGLGYYSRARNLHFTARYIVNELDGKFPDNFNDLLKLKGVGEYTAAAIASIAFGESVPANDGNAYRVLSRYFNVEMDIDTSKAKKYFFNLGKEIIDPKRPGDFNQAVMELGATVCLPIIPKCDSCPLNESCEALKLGKINALPVKSKKVKVKIRYLNFLDITDGENRLMTQRTGNDIWKNLYTFPMTETEKNENMKRVLNEIHSGFTECFTTIHLLTHQRLHITFWKLKTGEKSLENIRQKLNAEIKSPIEIHHLPLPKPMEKYLTEKEI